MAIDCVLYFGAEAIQVLKHIAASAVLGGLLGGRAHPQRDLEMWNWKSQFLDRSIY